MGYVFALCLALMLSQDAFGQRTFLVNMTSDDFKKDLNCISMSKSQQICDDYKTCVYAEPSPDPANPGVPIDDVIDDAYVICNEKLGIEYTWVCDDTHNLYTSPDIVSQLVDCIDETVVLPLETQEILAEEIFESCVKRLATQAGC